MNMNNVKHVKTHLFY